jgi:hypothetical protein
VKCQLPEFSRVFHNKNHQTEVRPGILAQDLLVGVIVMSHAASVENLFSYQRVVSNHNTREESWLLVGWCGTDAAMEPESTTVMWVKFIAGS